jgi:hypothetical protein
LKAPGRQDRTATRTEVQRVHCICPTSTTEPEDAIAQRNTRAHARLAAVSLETELPYLLTVIVVLYWGRPMRLFHHLRTRHFVMHCWPPSLFAIALSTIRGGLAHPVTCTNDGCLFSRSELGHRRGAAAQSLEQRQAAPGVVLHHPNAPAINQLVRMTSQDSHQQHRSALYDRQPGL